MRNYTRLDLIRFHRLASKEENKGKKPIELIKLFNELHPEKSSKEKLINLSKALGINNLHRALTGEDIPEGEDYFIGDEDHLNPAS